MGIFSIKKIKKENRKEKQKKQYHKKQIMILDHWALDQNKTVTNNIIRTIGKIGI